MKTFKFGSSDLNDSGFCSALIECGDLIQQHPRWIKTIDSLNYGELIGVGVKDGAKVLGFITFFRTQGYIGTVMQSNPFPACYGGIVTKCTGEQRALIFEEIFKVLKGELWTANRVDLVTIVTPPFVSDEQLYKEYFCPDFETANDYQFIRLPAKQKSKQKGNIRRRVQTAKNAKLEFEVSANMEWFEVWLNIVNKRLSDLNANPLPSKFYNRLATSMLEEQKGLFCKASLAGKPLAIGLYFYSDSVVDCFMRASDLDYKDMQPGVFLDYFSLEFFTDLGLQTFNWQSSPKQNKHIFDYKKNWGSLAETHYYLTKIINPKSAIFEASAEETATCFPHNFVLPIN